jgi:hypothetical protein
MQQSNAIGRWQGPGYASSYPDSTFIRFHEGFRACDAR